MTSILKVDTIQTAAGGTPTAADLGLNVSGSIVQTQHVTPCRRVSGFGENNTGVTLSTGTWTTPTYGSNPYQITYNALLSNSSVRVTVSGTTHGLGSNWVGLHQDRILSSSGDTYRWPQWRQTTLSSTSSQNHTSFYLTRTFDSSVLDGHTIEYQIMPHANSSSGFYVYEDLALTVEEIAG